jgi:tetratricopeptide (TPR) repeat protein
MKAEHRKELETNKLADKIGGFVQSFKEGPSRNAVIYGSLVGVVLLLLIIYRWVSANTTASDSARWLSWDQVATRTGLESFATENGETEQGRLARFELARLDLVDGLARLGSPISRTDGIKSVRRAAEAYKKLAGESGNTPQLTQEAMLNTAKALESLGEYGEAKQWYERLARQYPQSLKGKNAAEQAKALDSPGPDLEELKQLAKEGSETPPPSISLPSP